MRARMGDALFTRQALETVSESGGGQRVELAKLRGCTCGPAVRAAEAESLIEIPENPKFVNFGYLFFIRFCSGKLNRYLLVEPNHSERRTMA